jgi:polyphenol oxidase
LDGVLPAAVAAFGFDPNDLMAWLGPAISQASYEVGAEVRDAFVAHDAAASQRFAPNARGRWQADLYGLARDSLAAAGVAAVHGGGFCTYKDADRFFSHRREAPCGRMASLVWLDARGDDAKGDGR